MREQYDKLLNRLNANLEEVDRLMQQTSMPAYTAVPDPSALQNLLAECEDSDFWQNFKRAAPIIFCKAIEEDTNLKQLRDMSFIEEILKTKSILKVIQDKLEKGDADVDIVEYSLATKMLESKVSILKALNIDVGDDQESITLNVKGTTKSIVINLQKLREAITVQEGTVEEKEGTVEERKDLMDQIDIDTLTDDEFLNKAVEKIGEVKKTKNKTLTKDTFVKIFRMTGEYAKHKTKDIKKQAQISRIEHFGTDSKKYLAALKQGIQDEESTYQRTSEELFEKLCITPECFERTQ
jgi:hypothetical protein